MKESHPGKTCRVSEARKTMNEIQSLRSGQSEGTHKRGKRGAVPEIGGELAEPRKKIMTCPRPFSRIRVEVQDALQNNILKNV